jgi:hypothetical protein
MGVGRISNTKPVMRTQSRSTSVWVVPGLIPTTDHLCLYFLLECILPILLYKKYTFFVWFFGVTEDVNST